jgi:hypothetical protein
MKKQITFLFLFLFTENITFSQAVAPATYPQIKGYASIVHPIVTIGKNRGTFNFDNSYTVGFPFGINLLKSDKIGFSFELTPIIKVEGGTDKVSSLLFHPGVIFRFHNGFNFIQRLAFETNGRYGLTPVFNKILTKNQNASVKYFMAAPIPVRFGNDKPASVSIGLQFGINF